LFEGGFCSAGALKEGERESYRDREIDGQKEFQNYWIILNN
jgi:hypothetical protein